MLGAKVFEFCVFLAGWRHDLCLFGKVGLLLLIIIIIMNQL